MTLLNNVGQLAIMYNTNLQQKIMGKFFRKCFFLKLNFSKMPGNTNVLFFEVKSVKTAAAYTFVSTGKDIYCVYETKLTCFEFELIYLNIACHIVLDFLRQSST